MIVIIGLLVLIVAGGLAVSGVAANSGGAHPLGDPFVIFGQSVTGLSVGQVFLFGIIVGVAGMLGLAMLLGAFNRGRASRGSRRELTGSRRESAALRSDRERLSQQLQDERSEHRRVEASHPADGSRPADTALAADRVTADTADPVTGSRRSTAVDTAPGGRTAEQDLPNAERSGIWHRIGNRANR